MFLGDHWRIDDVLTFYVNAHDPTTAGEIDADSAPGYRVYEEETGTPILTGSMALLDSSNTAGFYSEQITLSAANGLEVGKCYCIRVTVVVGGVTGVVLRTFRMQPSMAEPTAIPAWPMTMTQAMAIMVAFATNHMEQNRSTGITTLRNRADSSTIGTSEATDNGTVLDRESFA